MNDKAKPNRREIVFGSPLSVAGVVGLLADSIGLAVLAAGVIFVGQTAQLWERFLILGTLFVAAIGLLLLGARGMKLDSSRAVMRFYAYVYAFLAAISYACVALILTLGDYSPAVYVGFWAILMVELIAFGILRFISKPTDHGWFAVPLGASTIWHGVLLVFVFVIMRVPLSTRTLFENIALLLAMLIVSALMYSLSELPGSARQRKTLRQKLP